MDFDKLAEHVKDSDRFHLPFERELVLPRVLGFQVTKYMVLELVAAALMLIIFLAIAQRLRRGGPPRGIFLEHVPGDAGFHPR